jgi:hypothetical protein
MMKGKPSKKSARSWQQASLPPAFCYFLLGYSSTLKVELMFLQNTIYPNDIFNRSDSSSY